MNDKQLIAKLQELRQIKPSQNWVVSVKRDIIGESTTRSTIFEILPGLFSQRKLAYAFIAVFMVLIGILGLFLIPTSNNNKLETDLLAAAVQSRYSLETANQKLENLTEVIKTNDANKITSAVKDADESIAQASKAITQDMVSNPKALKEIAGIVKEIDQNKKNLETLGVIVDEDYQLNSVLAPLVQKEIETLEGSTLNERQEIELREIKGLYDEGQYTDTLEKILLITDS